VLVCGTDPKPGDLLVTFISGELMTLLSIKPLPASRRVIGFDYVCDCKVMYPDNQTGILSLEGARRIRARYLEQYCDGASNE